MPTLYLLPTMRFIQALKTRQRQSARFLEWRKARVPMNSGSLSALFAAGDPPKENLRAIYWSLEEPLVQLAFEKERFAERPRARLGTGYTFF